MKVTGSIPVCVIFVLIIRLLVRVQPPARGLIVTLCARVAQSYTMKVYGRVGDNEEDVYPSINGNVASKVSLPIN